MTQWRADSVTLKKAHHERARMNFDLPEAIDLGLKDFDNGQNTTTSSRNAVSSDLASGSTGLLSRLR
jgi:hypothetical protein